MKIKINYLIIFIIGIFVFSINVKADDVIIEDDRYINDEAFKVLADKGLQCADKVYITTCFEKRGVGYCNFTFNNISGIVKRQNLTNEQEAAKSSCAETGYWDAHGEYYVKKGSQGGSTELSCGTKLNVTVCDNSNCYYTSYTDKNNKLVEIENPESIPISSITYDIKETGCYEEPTTKAQEPEETCINPAKLNVSGAITFNVCYNKNLSAEEVKEIAKNAVSCKYKHVVDETSIRATGKVVKGKKYNTCDYTVECILKEKPTVSVESAIVDRSGYGEIKVTAKSSSAKIVAYYASEDYLVPTNTTKWTQIDSGNFTIRSTPGVMYIWVKDSLGNISDVVSGAVIDTVNTSTTVTRIQLLDANGNNLSLNSRNSVSYYYSKNNISLYSNLSNKLADNFNPFDMEYTLEVDTPTVTLFATLTSSDSDFVEGYGPRTVNLSYGVNTVLIKIKNREGKIRTYTIIVTRKDSRNADNTLKDLNLSVGEINFNANVTKYKIEIPKSTESVVVSSKLSSDLSSYVQGFEPGVVNITGNTTVKLIKVRSQTGSNRTYILSFVKEGTDEINKESLQLFSLSIPNAYVPFESDISNYNIVVDYSTNLIDIYANAKESTSEIKYSKKDANNNYVEISSNNIPLDVGDNYINIEVKDKDGDISYYRLTIIRKEFGLDISNNTLLSDLQVLDYNLEFDPLVKDYEVKIKQEKSLIITAVPENNRSEIFILGNENLTGFSTVRIKVVAENGEYQVYSINIKKDPFNKELEKIAIIAGVVIILLSSCIIIVKKKYRARKDYYRE